MALTRHFERFKHAIETRELILAGRTPESGDKTFGIAIFEAKDEEAARKFMESDPAVVAGLMTARNCTRSPSRFCAKIRSDA